MKIFVNIPKGAIRDSFLPPYVCSRLEEVGETTYNNTEQALVGEEFVERAKKADVVVTGWGQPLITAEMIPNVKMVAHTGGTVNGIIDESVYDAGIKVLSGNQYYAESVAEGVLAYMLFELRRMGYYSNELKAGNWIGPDLMYTEGLFDSTVGIISVGAISRLVIELLKPFRVKLKVFSTNRDMEFAKKYNFEYAELDEIFSTCKIISVHTAANAKTHHMIKKEHFEMIKDGSIFINTSRGAVIDEAAFAEELKKNRFRALLDVYQIEPLPADSPLLGLDNVTLFPHQAGPTTDRRPFVTSYLIDDIESHFSGGDVQNEVTKEIAARMTKS